MEYDNYFRIEVLEVVMEEIFFENDVEYLRTCGKEYMRLQRISIPLSLLRDAVLSCLDGKSDVNSRKLQELGRMKFDPVFVVIGGKGLLLYHDYDEFTDKMDDIMNKDMSVYNYKNFSFISFEYGRRN